MTPCVILGHHWRFVVATQLRDGLRWSTFLCRRCPARIELAAGWPDAGGLFTRGDLATIGAMLVTLAAIVAVTHR